MEKISEKILKPGDAFDFSGPDLIDDPICLPTRILIERVGKNYVSFLPIPISKALQGYADGFACRQQTITAYRFDLRKEKCVKLCLIHYQYKKAINAIIKTKGLKYLMQQKPNVGDYLAFIKAEFYKITDSDTW